MRVEFEFDREKVEARGYTLEDVHYTIKGAFAEYSLPCVTEGAILAFSGVGRRSDFSNLWTVIMELIETDWFLEIATACYWCEDGQRVEDVLSQAKADFKTEGK